MSDELFELRDGSGNIRRCGALLPDMNLVKASNSKYFEDVCPNMVMTQSEIIKRLQNDPDRIPARKMFDDHWVIEGDQKQFGSCNGWMTASIESKLRFKRGFTDGIVLSGSYIYSLLNNGRDYGSALQDDIGAMTTHGAPPASMCPANNIWRKNTEQFDDEAAKYKQLNWLPVRTLDGFFSAIYFGALGGSAVDVNNAFANFKGDGICPVGNGNGNHAVHVDDVVVYKGTLCADSPGNWGMGFGSRGRCYFTRDSYAKPFKNHQFYVGFSTLEGQ